MEDLVVHHDFSVRDAGGNIIQYVYGDDRIEGSRVESQELKILQTKGPVPGEPADAVAADSLRFMHYADVLDKYGWRNDEKWEDFLAPQVAKEIRSGGKETLKELNRWCDEVRDNQRTMLFNAWGRVAQEAVYYPVNLNYLITQIASNFKVDRSAKTDLSPVYVARTVRNLLDTIGNGVFSALMHYWCSPRRIVKDLRYTRKAWDYLIENIRVRHVNSMVPPGEMVGVIAAQSMGEPATQMSAPAATLIWIAGVKNGKDFRYYGAIGTFIDNLLKETPEKVVELEHNSVVMDPVDDYYIIGVGNDEKTKWNRISQVSKHPINGQLVKVTTRTGKVTTATLSHSFLHRTEKGIEAIEGSALKIGMRIPVAKQLPNLINAIDELDDFELTNEFGWICGMYLADGWPNKSYVSIAKIQPVIVERLRKFATDNEWKFTITKKYNSICGSKKKYEGQANHLHSKELSVFLQKHFGSGSYNKRIGYEIFHANDEFMAGLVSGWFDGDGNTNAEKQLIRAHSRSEKLVHDIITILARFGIFASAQKETSIRIPGAVMHIVQVTRKYARQFKEQIGLCNPDKYPGLDAIIEYNERDNKHDSKNYIDSIHGLNTIVAETGKLLALPGQSRNYGRWNREPKIGMAIGRDTLELYLQTFTEALETVEDETVKETVMNNIAQLEQAVNSDVLWDEIINLEYLDDPDTFVYDFTVPGNDSFMVDDNIFVHNTLNTFHLAGVASKSNVIRGVPRLKEILKATKNPKASSLTIYLRPDIRSKKTDAHAVLLDLELTKLRDLTLNARIYLSPKPDSVGPEDRDFVRYVNAFAARMAAARGEAAPAASLWYLRLELDREKMLEKNVSMEDVTVALNSVYNGKLMNTIYSDTNYDKLIMRIPLDGLASVKDTDHLQILKAVRDNILDNTIIRGIPGISGVTMEHIEFAQQVEELKTAKGERKRVLSTAITLAQPEYDDAEWKPIDEWVLYTNGTNFLEVMNHPMVDGTRLLSNNIWDIYENLGVEATRTVLIDELTSLFEEAYVNSRHLQLLVDFMTSRGRMISIDRNGINSIASTGPLAKACFEETDQIIMRAAVYGEIDEVTGVSANIMMGQPIRGGTGFAQILLDVPEMMRLNTERPPEKPIVDYDTTVDDEIAGLGGGRGECVAVQTAIQVTLPREIVTQELGTIMEELEPVIV